MPQGRNAAVVRRGCFAFMKNMVRSAQDGIGGCGMNTENELILVDLDDRETGRGEKTDVHRRGLLHRAFSLFLFVKTYTLYEFAGKYHIL